MKSAFFLAALIFSVNQPKISENPVEKTFYYFCVSRPMEVPAIDGIKTVMYTPVMEITCDEPYIKKLAKAWGSQVSKQCKHPNCTSDLNYYPTLEEAKTQLEKFKGRYAGSTEYVLEKVAFNPDISQ